MRVNYDIEKFEIVAIYNDIAIYNDMTSTVTFSSSGFMTLSWIRYLNVAASIIACGDWQFTCFS